VKKNIVFLSLFCLIVSFQISAKVGVKKTGCSFRFTSTWPHRWKVVWDECQNFWFIIAVAQEV